MVYFFVVVVVVDCKPLMKPKGEGVQEQIVQIHDCTVNDYFSMYSPF